MVARLQTLFSIVNLTEARSREAAGLALCNVVLLTAVRRLVSEPRKMEVGQTLIRRRDDGDGAGVPLDELFQINTVRSAASPLSHPEEACGLGE